MSFWPSPYDIFYIKKKKQLAFRTIVIFGSADKPYPQQQHCNCFIHNKVIINILLVKPETYLIGGWKCFIYKHNRNGFAKYTHT